jgi:hypothetical protein
MEYLFYILPIAALLFIGAIFFFIISHLTKGREKYKSTPTFDEYRNANPNLVNSGKVTCSVCGGNQIYVRLVGNIGVKQLNFHVCRTCGSNLYRSES